MNVVYDHLKALILYTTFAWGLFSDGHMQSACTYMLLETNLVHAWPQKIVHVSILHTKQCLSTMS